MFCRNKLIVFKRCEAITLRVVAQEQNRKLGKINIDVDGTLDLRGFLGLAKVNMTFYCAMCKR